MIKHLLCIFLLAQTLPLVSQSLWTDISEQAIPQADAAPRYIVPLKYRTVRIDLTQLQALLVAAPERFTTAAADQELILTLPLPNGAWGRFRLSESPVMAPALQAKYPEIRCYTGTGIDDPTALLKCDLTPQGFHAMIHSARHSPVFIDPYRKGDIEHCIVYDKKDFQSKKEPFSCGLDELAGQIQPDKIQDQPEAQGDCTFRRYRLALACTGEYAVFHGGTKALALAAMNTTMNRVNGIYERDFAITMQLIANNDVLVFTDPVTDGYSNGNGGTMLGQNQTKCNTVIGAANYDIGHVFSTGGGGVAGLGVVCGNSVKARGVTGTSQPVGDPFDVDYAAHEIGHQFGGNHCFNNPCSGNINPSTAFEPGSGSTIMAYAGVCNPNVQTNSDAYFHAISLQEIGNYVTNGQGGVCPVEVNTGNTKPAVSPGTNYTIPKSTPFALTAVATDINGDSLTYCWEQMDNTQAPAPPVSTSAAGPLFRSYNPSPSPTRYFPRLPDLVNNINSTWEELPGVARAMNFRVSVRDNNPAGGCTHETNVQLTVSGSAGPFLVTAPNTPLSWFIGDSKMVSWDVANTNMAPVNCAQVRILLSTDGGFTYPIVLADAVPNTGSAMVDVPDAVSTTCRVMVQSVGNVFFDISDQNFSIAPPPVPTFLLSISAGATEQRCVGDTLGFTADLSAIAGFSDMVDLELDGAPAGSSLSINPNPALPGSTADIQIADLDSPGVYPLTLTATSGVIVRTRMFELTVVDNAPSAPALSSPADGAVNQTQSPSLNWTTIPNALSYHVQVATGPAFYPAELVYDQSATTPSANLSGLDTATVYYWRVLVENSCGQSLYSTISAFQTGKYGCGYSFNSTDVPVAISASDIDTVTSTLVIPEDRTIADVELRVQINHSWVGDLLARLISPTGVSAQLFDQPGFPFTSSGCNGDSLSIHFDDEATLTAVQLENTCGNLPAISGSYQPLQLLSRYDNASSQGTWKLEVTDNFPEDGGAITGWSLSFCFFDSVPAAVLLVNSPLTLASGTTGLFTDSHLDLSISSTVPDEGIYTLLSLPQHGEITLNALPLGIGDHFTQADILVGSLEYTHNGNTASSDNFLFDAVDASSGAWVHSATFDIIILQNDLDVTADLTENLVCHNDSTAQITVAVAGGTAPFFYSLNGGTAQASNVFDGLPAGMYTVEVSDFYGFTATSNSLVVNNPAAIVVNAEVTNDDIAVQVIGAAAPLEYSLDGMVFQPENLFENLPNATYTVTVRDANGCTGSTTATINVGPLNAVAVLATPVSCNDGADGSITVNAGGGVAPYMYSLNGVDFQMGKTFTGLSAGTYTLIVQDDSGNTATTNALVLADPAAITATAVATLNVITVTAGGGTGALTYSLDGQAFQPENIFQNLPNGAYTITVKDTKGCTATTTASVNVPPLVIVSLTIEDKIFCVGETGSLRISAAGGVPPYEYSLDGGTYQTDSLFENVGAGLHTISVRDAAGTVITSPVISLVEPTPLALTILLSGKNLVAEGLGGTPPYLYALDNGVPQPIGEFFGLANGTHQIVVIDANGCVLIKDFDLFYPPLEVQVATTDPLCNGGLGTMTLLISGGTPPYTCGGTPCNMGGLPAGVYTLVITDALGDTAEVTFTISSPPALTAGAMVSSDTITIMASGGSGTLQYSLDGVVYQDSPLFAGVPNGTYTPRVKDENGCTAIVSPPVVVNFVGTISPEQAWGLSVLPNPSGGRFFLNFRQAPAGLLRADVFDTAGRLIFEQRYEAAGVQPVFELDLSGFPSGVYWLRLMSGTQVGGLRVVVR